MKLLSILNMTTVCPVCGKEMNENGSNTELLLDLQKELDNKTKELEEKYERWEYLSERAD